MKSIFVTDKASIKRDKSEFNRYDDKKLIDAEFILNTEIKLNGIGRYILVIEDDRFYQYSIAVFLSKCDLFDTTIHINDIDSFYKVAGILTDEPLIVSLDFFIGETSSTFKDTSGIYNTLKEYFPEVPVIGLTNYEETEHPGFPSDTIKLINLLNTNLDSVYDKKNISTSSTFNNIIRDKLRIAKIIKENAKLYEENIALEEKNITYEGVFSSYPQNSGKDYLIGTSLSMRKVFYEMHMIKRTLVRVLIRGSRGVGKELVARAIYEDSPWGLKDKERPFITINCAEFEGDPMSAMSKLFGHVKGAYTDAKTEREGALQKANNGTLFLDEVGLLPKNVQEKLLRFLETKEFSKLGSDIKNKSKLRLICATNANLEELMGNDQFRKDFYDRIKRYEIFIPDLSERKEDIPSLIEYYLSNKEVLMDNFGNSEINFTITEAAITALKNINYAGNIRDLNNYLITAMVNSLNFNNEINLEIINNITGVKENLTSKFNDTIQFLDKICEILNRDEFDNLDKVNISHILPYFESSRTRKTGMHRVHFSSEELAPRKPFIRDLYLMYPDRWSEIKEKKLNLISK
jgi:transcriptional regulator with GAF, ATPase, and Fis domain